MLHRHVDFWARIASSIFLLLAGFSALAQAQESPKPLGTRIRLDSSASVLVAHMESSRTGVEGAIHALPHSPTLGSFTVGEVDGISVFVRRFRIEGAHATSVHIENLRLRKGEALFIYADDQDEPAREFFGPILDAGPGAQGDLWTLPVEGDTVVLEYQTSYEDASTLPFEVTELASVPIGILQESIAVRSRDRLDQTGASPVDPRFEPDARLVEGDILLSPPSATEHSIDPSSMGVGRKNARHLWPGGIIPYVISADLAVPSRVNAAVDHWNQRLAGTVRLVPRTSESRYLEFVRPASASNCSSYVGYLNMAGQPIYAGDYCSTGNLIHEIGHAFGLYHEHNRLDRDLHLEVQWPNISSAGMSSFERETYDGRDLGAFDFGSIMHYGAYTYSSNGHPTLLTKPAGIPIGQRSGLSSGDVAAIVELYESAPALVTSHPSSVTLVTNPSSMQLVVDEMTTGTPASFNWAAGSSHILTAPSWDNGTTKFRFSHWSNGQAQTQVYVASGTTPTTLTANYTLSHKVTWRSSNDSKGSVRAATGSSGSYFAAGTQLTLHAIPADGQVFSGWGGGIAGTTNPITITVSTPLEISAAFDTVPVVVSQPAVQIKASPTTASVSKAGGVLNVSLTAGQGTSWKALSGVSWVVPLQPTGSGSATVSFSILPNNIGAWRSTRVSVAGVIILIQQAPF